MSDFLNQFSSKNYKKTENTSSPPRATAPFPLSGTDTSIVSEGLSDSTSPNRAKITAPDHDIEIDRGYHKRKIIRYGIIAGTVITVMVFVLLMVSILNQITVKNFVGTPLNDAKTWGLTNKISLEIETVFSNEYDENFILTQSKDPGEKIRKGSVLVFQVSLGPDPNETILLPDFSIMDTPQLYSWKEQNKANNVNIMQEFSDTAEMNRFIRMEFNNASINETNYTRKDGLLIYMSKGPFEKNISVPDFKEKTKTEADAWAKENKIEAIYTEQASEKAPKGSIISQDIEPGTKIAQNTKITFVICLGKAVIVPDFKKLTKDEAAVVSDLSVTVKTQYSTSVPYGRLISQSVPAGRQLIEEAPKVTAVYSEGRPYIDDLKGKTEKDLQAYFYDFSAKGAEITYSVVYVNSNEPKGQVVGSQPFNQFVEMKQKVIVQISTGNP